MNAECFQMECCVKAKYAGCTHSSEIGMLYQTYIYYRLLQCLAMDIEENGCILLQRYTKILPHGREKGSTGFINGKPGTQ